MWAKKKQNENGFTIVELLIVIVVIAILAAITIVSYNGIQARSRDSVRRQDLAQITKLMKMYQVDNGDYAEAGCGSGTGYGWFAVDYDGAGPLKSISQCLIDTGFLMKTIKDPGGLDACAGLTCYAYMKASCGGNTYLYAHLETLPQSSTDLDGSCYPTWDTSYGMNYIRQVN
ncbi:MAG: type II secretion system protein [Candidatus Saccharimonas sp.]